MILLHSHLTSAPSPGCPIPPLFVLSPSQEQSQSPHLVENSVCLPDGWVPVPLHVCKPHLFQVFLLQDSGPPRGSQLPAVELITHSLPFTKRQIFEVSSLGMSYLVSVFYFRTIGHMHKRFLLASGYAVGGLLVMDISEVKR